MNRASSALRLALLFALGPASLLQAASPSGYYLVWSDEFNESSLDTSKWGYRLPGAYRDAYNTPSAVSFNGSNLVITTYTEGGTNFSCMLYSKGKFESKYGYWESSVAWGDSNGTWSSFWMLCPSQSFSASSIADLDEPQVAGSEIDTCEHRYVDSSNTNVIANQIEVNLHWYDGSTTEINSPGSGLVGSGLAGGFHTYGFLWTSNAYSFSVDGTQVGTQEFGGVSAPVSQCTEYTLLSTAVDDTSTTWAGYIPSGGYGSMADSSAKFTVDYVRYYAPTNVLFWLGSSSTVWDKSANWLSNMPPASNSFLTFSYLSGSALSTTPGQNYAVDGLVILTTSGNVSISGGNTLTLGAGGLDAIAANHTVTVSAPVVVAAPQIWGIGLNSSSSAANTLTVSGGLSGTNAITKSCYGTLILSGANSFSGPLNVDTGTTNNDGILEITTSGTLASPVAIRNAGYGSSTLQLAPSSGGITFSQSATLAGRNTNVVAIENVAGSNSFTGGLSLLPGGPLYLVQSDAGTLNLGGTISAGGGSGPLTLAFQGVGNFYISGNIQNGSASAINVLKTNSGTLIFSGTNTYTGATTIAGGNALVTGSLAGGLTVAGGCSLGGGGSIGGAVTIQSGGMLSPGISTGALSFGGSLVLNSGSATVVELNAASSTNGRIVVTGTLSRGGTLTVSNVAGTLAPGQSFKLFNAGSFSGAFSTVNLPALGAGLSWNTNQLTNGLLSIPALPPPQFTSILAQPNGGFVLGGAGAASQTYTLQAATNLIPPVAWVSITNVVAGSNGLFQFTDSPPAGLNSQFYRVLSSSP